MFCNVLTFATVISAKCKVQQMLMGMSKVLKVFGFKAKYWTNENFDLMMVLDEKLTDHQKEYTTSWGGHESKYQMS